MIVNGFLHDSIKDINAQGEKANCSNQINLFQKHGIQVAQL
jgi:hypothetical protein